MYSASVYHRNVIPAGSGALFFMQIFAMISYSVLFSTLVLYITKGLGLNANLANIIMGVFGAFNFSLQLLGGYLGGRYLSNRNLFVLGMIAKVIGCYLLANMTTSGLYWGLTLFLTGSGFNVACINMMLTQRFAADDNRRESAFLWNYAALSLGFCIGLSLAGYFELSENYRTLFLFAAAANLITIMITLLRWPVVADINTPLRQIRGQRFYWRMIIGLLIVLLLIPTLRILMSYVIFSGGFMLLLAAIIFILLCFITVHYHQVTERRRMQACLILTAGSLVFWSLYQLVPTGLVLFSVHNIDLTIYGLRVAPQWLQNTTQLVLIVGGPFMAWLFKHLRDHGIRIDVPGQFATSLLCMGLGMLVLPLGISLAGSNGLMNIKWIIISYILQGIGELLISPIGYAMIGKLVPARLQGFMMGYWMMINGVASVLASYLSGLMPQNTGSTPMVTNPGYSHIFTVLGLSSVATGLLFVLLIPLLRRLITMKT